MYKKKPLEPRKTPLPKDDGEILTNGKKVYRTNYFERAVANKAGFALSDVHTILVAFREVIIDILKEDAILNLPGLFKIYHNITKNKPIRDVVNDVQLPNAEIHSVRIIPSKKFYNIWRPERYSKEFWDKNNEKRKDYLSLYWAKKKMEKLALKENDENLSNLKKK